MTRKCFDNLPQQLRALHQHPGLLHGNPLHIDSILWMRIEMLALHAEALLRARARLSAAAPALRNLTPPHKLSQRPQPQPNWVSALACYGD